MSRRPVGVVLYVMHTDGQKARADAILEMRRYIRSKYQDIRARADIFRDMWGYIDKLTGQEVAEPPPKPKKTTRKRKARKDDADDDDNDDAYTDEEGRRPRGKGRRKA